MPSLETVLQAFGLESYAVASKVADFAFFFLFLHSFLHYIEELLRQLPDQALLVGATVLPDPIQTNTPSLYIQNPGEAEKVQEGQVGPEIHSTSLNGGRHFLSPGRSTDFVRSS